MTARLLGLVVGVALILGACASAATTATPTPTRSASATVAPSLPATPAPTADVAVLFETAYRAVSSGTIALSGTITVGTVQTTLNASEDFNGLDSKSDTSTTTAGVATHVQTASLGGTRYVKRGNGPWLVDLSTAAPSKFDDQLRAAAASVSDAGSSTHGGVKAHRLVPPPGFVLDPVALGFASGHVDDVTSTVAFFAADDGTPLGATIESAWSTPTDAAAAVMTKVELHLTFSRLGVRPIITKPSPVWLPFSSTKDRFALAYPPDFEHTVASDHDYFIGPDGTWVFALRADLPANATLNVVTNTEISDIKQSFAAKKVESAATSVNGVKARFLSAHGTFNGDASVLYEVVMVRGQDEYAVLWIAPEDVEGSLADFQALLSTFQLQ